MNIIRLLTVLVLPIILLTRLLLAAELPTPSGGAMPSSTDPVRPENASRTAILLRACHAL